MATGHNLAHASFWNEGIQEFFNKGYEGGIDLKKHEFLRNPNFRMQCHGVYIAPDGEPIMCNTLSQSYRDHYVAMGGQKTCQDCHMRAKNRGHTFPGAYNLDTLRDIRVPNWRVL